ncbi:MAG: hypothetical protein J4469_05135 [Candidatus Aenigmarchaeota archaeon]|nr:MAG: hypothetical protein QT02_C0008G0013 [archaeon GW2011_AR9]MBS3053857.1 hypothetical protein [Candidatus Aenigmarchaeota archaeon]MBS3120993.1 hypothetical protein [Candidatus Woesearchaeota archaeon]HIH13295.1 hypothetical protein [Candidatus Woesearchaeota archaeon]HLC71850.1 hypothetical protein [Candidatus Nanoarchaeia archaeon]
MDKESLEDRLFTERMKQGSDVLVIDARLAALCEMYQIALKEKHKREEPYRQQQRERTARRLYWITHPHAYERLQTMQAKLEDIKRRLENIGY